MAPAETSAASPVPEPEQAITLPPAPETAATGIPVAGKFAPAPERGWIIRSNCRMGGCSWARFEQAMRSGSSEAPVYELRLTLGDSQHPQGPYPNRADGVDIVWEPQPVPAQVKCSTAAPYAMIENEGDHLKLGPQGVAGAVQGLANLYFAACHGEYGDDALLARKYGYAVR